MPPSAPDSAAVALAPHIDLAGPLRSMSVVIPVYNSEATIARVVDATVECLTPAFERIEVILVNDGSRDRTHQQCQDAAARHAGIVKYIRLARNFGEHNAVMCGLRHVTCECAGIIDDDFQNPPEELLRLAQTLERGYDVVYSYYAHKQHHWLRNLGSKFNDSVATILLRKPKGLYLSSFKVLNRFLVDAVTEYDGPYPYIDGLILRATDAIGRCECAHEPRAEGRSNYTLRRLVRVWLNMSTNFSILPLRVATVLGFATSFVGLGLAVFFTISRFVGGIFRQGAIPPGWASTIVTLTVLSGFQMAVLGVLGEYLGRLFLSENRTPQFVVRSTVGVEPDGGVDT